MSDANVLLGYIDEALWTYQPDRNFFRRANDAVLDALPTDDAWPPLCRSLFSSTGADSAHGSFRGQRLIHFAGKFNYFGDDLSPWLDKLESLLKRMYWMRATVFLLETWSSPPLHLRYEVLPSAIQSYMSAEPQPPNSWQVAGDRITEADDVGNWASTLIAERRQKCGGAG